MRQRDIEHFAYLRMKQEEESLTRKFGNLIVTNCMDLDSLKLNTIAIQQDVGKIKILRDLLS